MIDPTKPNLGGTPVAPWRPRLEYSAADPAQAPVVSVVTPFLDGGPRFLETVESMLGQSLQAWEWILVDDACREADARSLLGLASERDARIRVVGQRVQQGRSRALNAGFLAARAPFVQLLERDDLLEATTLEKLYWALLSHEEWSFVGSWSVARGALDEIRHTDFGETARFLSELPGPRRALIRRDVFLRVGGFDTGLRDGCEEWDFWLRCASRGLWGGTLPEPLVWFRSEESPPTGERAERIEAFRAALPRRFPALVQHGFPATPVPATGVALEEAPSWNRLAPHIKRMLVVLPTLASDGTGGLLLELLPLLRRRGWQITVASVAVAGAEAPAAWARLGADLHVLDHFLRPADHPRFLRHLVESRRPDWVLCGPGRFTAAVRAYLRDRCAAPRYAELCHLDPDDASVEPLGAVASAMDASADLRLCTDEGDPVALSEGAKVVRLPPAVDTTIWKPRSAPRQWMRPQWGASPDELVLLFAGRLGPLTRSDVLADTVLALVRSGAPVRAVVAAAGPGLADLRARLSGVNVGDRVRFPERQTPDMLLRTCSAADLFFLPSRGGTAIGVLRAMACGLPAVTAATGAHARIVDATCGVLVSPGEAAAEVRAYADAIERLAREPGRCAALGRAARQRVIAHFDLDALALPVLSSFTTSESRPLREPTGTMASFHDLVAFCEAGGHAGSGAPT